MNKIDRYLQIFNNYLFVKNKQEIVAELREDIMECLENDNSDENIEKVLSELGNPRQLALDYISEDKYLIGPQLYDKFIYALIATFKITYLVYFIVAIVLIIIQILVSEFSLFDLFDYFYLLIPIGIIAFLVVLIIFIIFEKVNNVDEDFQTLNSRWDINELNNEVNEGNDFKFAYFSFNLIASTAATILGLVIILKDYYINTGDYIYVLNIINDKYNQLIIITSIIYLVLDQVYRFYLFKAGRYTKLSLLFMVLNRIYLLIASYLLFLKAQIINENILDLNYNLDLNLIIFYIMIIIIIAEIIVYIYKYFKYKKI